MSHTKDKIYALVQDIAHEARALRSCDHSNIQSLIGVAPFEDSLALISPWMQQGDLSKLIYQPDSGLSSKDRYTLSIQIADSVSYLHNLNILHVDIKSSNVLLSSDLKPKLADFGSAMMNEVSTEHRNIVASLHWAPPEFAMRRQPSPGWDVHSLGMTIFEIFAGCMPYDGIQRNTVQAHIILRKLPGRPQNRLPVGDRQCDRLWELLLKCWAQDPLCRPTASEVRDELKLISEISC
ncbi:putative serine/threonine-protein kinase DDB_G0267514 OS=Dictyostelium discoideum GN=DDB_G0267514 PE=3 SV=1 [Rhizoctonia solani AG-1 IB]|uniref:Putative serine/threonine-protein kinase DDB_G0267514 n=1 Tax=Thanatephorus cucumeris (strain AG1-IB / isolate 7/3/14) TaxID=1108050 RepID=A0A0B7FFD6_THACB|nr:putative serine/threonine-protein kinase DDB_G0267514 OS=Dictyostelium discoideum GN=DDB_G0267514 PE=3 SV=1 [Rhizoctonia solani AG-1 IB]